MRSIGIPELIVMLIPLAFITLLIYATKRAKAVVLEGNELARDMTGGQRHLFEGSRKSPHSAMMFAFFLGDFGAHRFYLGQNGLGILYAVFFWTFVPGIIARIEVLLLPERVRRYNQALALEISGNEGHKSLNALIDVEKVKEVLAPSAPLTGRMVKTLDDVLTIYRQSDFTSAVVSRPAKGTEVRIVSLSEIDGREWYEVELPNGERGHVLGSSS